jgi:hypothetical protein
MEDRKTDFEGSTTELLSELDITAASLKMNIKAKGWPKSANALSRKLNEIKPNLEEVGIEISYDKDPKTKIKKVRVKLCNSSLMNYGIGHVFKIPKSFVEGFNGSEVLLNVPSPEVRGLELT